MKEGGEEGITNPRSTENENLHLMNEKGASRKGKSCKGCLYYSSFLKSNHRNPLCVGFTRSLPKAPRYYVGESEMEASKEGRSLADFRYGCVGYSVYSDIKNNSGDAQESEKELPVCAGIEVLVDRKATNANSAPTHAHNKDTHAVPQPRVSRPAQGQSAADDFFSRFTRNATVVASGVAKNVRKVGNQIKESVDDILYPYRRRPKQHRPHYVSMTEGHQQQSWQSPRYYVGESEMEASKEGRRLADFRYGCVGYSVYSDIKNNSGDAQESEKELPVCAGIEVLVDRKVTNANSAPTHAHNKDTHAVPQPRVSRPAQGQSAADDFFSRFTRNATVVASGVAKNVRKVGNQIKESVDDILYPYRRRPK